LPVTIHVAVPQCHNAVQALHLLLSSVAFTITALVTYAHVKWRTMMHNTVTHGNPSSSI